MASATGVSSGPEYPVIERASASDRAFLAMDSVREPEQFGVVLSLEGGGQLGLSQVRRLLAERVPAVPRLRQRLVRPPFGCGGPIWVDDPEFDIGKHVRAVVCPEPGDERALLDTAVSVITTPLPRAAPLWSTVLVTGLAGGESALVLVLHHVLADGVGGLAVLAGLTDAPARPHDPRFPRPAPARADLARDGWAIRLRAPGNLARACRQLRSSMRAAGGLRPPRATPCSLNQRAGSRRQLTAVHADLAAVRAGSHRFGATANDAVLVAVAGALGRVLDARGEHLDTIVLAVPVSGRTPAGEGGLGNMVSPMLVSVPTVGAVPDRLRLVAARVRAGKSGATGPPPIAVLGWLFRPLAALGGFRWYMNHQHRFHTLVSHVRGPAEPVAFAGAPITRAVPLGVGPGGNIPVYFEALSYAGALTLSVITDPGRFPDPDELAGALHDELDLISHPAADGAVIRR